MLGLVCLLWWARYRMPKTVTTYRSDDVDNVDLVLLLV